METLRPVDVICQHSADGKVIPLQIRLTDEDGFKQTYRIKDYRDRSNQGAHQMPDGVFVHDGIMVFECHIVVFDRLRLIRLYYNTRSGTNWQMTG